MKNSESSKKRYTRKKRTEFAKSVLIVVLLGLFCFQTILIINTPTLSNLLFLDNSDSEIILNDDDVINLYFEYTAPEYIMINKDGARDVFYSNSEYYQKAQIILQEINRSVFMPDIKPEPIEDGLFDKLTEIDSVYISYPYRRYPKYSAQFLNTTEESLSSFISYYKKVILVPETLEEKEKVTVYIQDEKTKSAVKITTQIASVDLVKYMDSIKGVNKKNYAFAHEFNFGIANTNSKVLASTETKINGDILIPLKNISLPQISIHSPLELGQNSAETGATPAAEEVIKTFGFTSSGARRYFDNNGVLVCVDEKATLKLFPDGIIEYNAVNKQSGLNLTGSSKLTKDNSYFLSFTGISRIINSIIPLAGNVEKSFKIRLTDLQSESVEVSEYKFIFDYYMNGTRIKNSPYHGIEATAVAGNLTYMRINLKRFDSSHSDTPVDSIISAIDNFCLNRNGSGEITITDAFLAYSVEDNSDILSAVWTIQ